MRTRQRRRVWAPLATLCAALLAVTGMAGAAGAEEGPGQDDLPVFEFQGIITDKEEMLYNPTDEYIFPSVFHAGEHLADPLGEWYLYLAPHDAPGGVVLMYADSLEGPWTEHPGNPLIANTWLPHYDTVSHVSTPEAFWHPTEQKLFLYFHGENSTTRYATSTDGVTFEYGGVAVTNADGGPGTSETSYARVFEHPDEASAYEYAMFYMDNTPENIRRIRVAESVDGRDWDVRAEPLVVPGAEEGQNVSSANLWEWEGQLYVIYHASSGKIHARTVDPTLTETGPTLTLHKASGVGEDTGRVAAPEIVTDETGTYLFYEAGDRLGATIAYAKLNPDAVRPPDPVPDPDPLREQCAGVDSDEFDGTELDADLWPVRVRADASRHELRDGSLVLPTYHSGVNGAPLLLQQVPDGAWEVTTEVRVSPTERFQQAGLLLYRDDANYAKLDLVHGSFGPRLEFIRRVNGSDINTSADSLAPPAGLGETFWLRLSSDGTAVSASVSVDGETFQPWGRSHDLGALAPVGVGPFAMRGATAAAEIEAEFAWLRWTPTEEEQAACDAVVVVPEVPADEETEAPGEADLRSTSGWATGLDDGNFEVLMDLWWGTNGSVFTLYENGELIAAETLSLDTPEAQSLRIPVTGRVNGTYVYTGELINSQGATATTSVTVEVTDAGPGTPVLSHDNRKDGDGDYTVTANMWWGTNATSYRILEDGAVIAEGELEAATPSAQQVSAAVSGKGLGAYTYVVELTNHAGTTVSEPLTVTVRR
ncbi:DUF1349 domain-containing protein [Georgenia sp. M64]|uniref:beta-xylosidase family glycoside hydrolase n=1 Tax=Georgenia sp. M64 TaxID=3120520 RepID=UPI0030E059F9